MHSTKQKRKLVMSKVLTTVPAVVALGLAAIRPADARAINSQHHHFRPGYTGQVYSLAKSALPWEFLPGRGIVGASYELPSSACSDDERVTG
jgi:hypothetical protein